jgi:hypothetical protein
MSENFVHPPKTKIGAVILAFPSGEHSQDTQSFPVIDGTEMRTFIREEMAAEAEQQMQDLHAMLEDRYGPAIAQGIMDKMGKIGS